MKYFNLATAIILSLATSSFIFAHGGGMHMMSGSTTGHCNHMMGYDMMVDTECPMMDEATSADYLLLHKDELDLSKTQIMKLEEIRVNYQEEVATLRANYNAAISKLHTLLGEDELNSHEIKAEYKRIEKLKSDLHSKYMDSSTSAKLLLTEEQLKKTQGTRVPDKHHKHGNCGCCGMMMR
jgi:hypothetical protein